jgi:hypothetical protein
LKKNVPIYDFAMTVKVTRRYITKEMIKDLAEKSYSENGRGITFNDLQIEFHISKAEAQRTLKHMKGFLFTAQDLPEDLRKLTGLQRKIPQEYYLNSKKVVIIENRKNNNVLKDTTGSSTDLFDLEKSQILKEWFLKISETKLYIHKLQLQTTIDKENYELLSHLPKVGNYRVHYERIGNVKGYNVEYHIYTNGTVMIYVTCSENPFRLYSGEDVSIIMIFLGKVDDRLRYLVADTKDKVVPLVMNWILKNCDVNKDIEIDEKAQITLPAVQIKTFEKVLRAYVKIIGEKAFYRGEAGITPNKPVVGALEDIRRNSELEKDFSFGNKG